MSVDYRIASRVNRPERRARNEDAVLVVDAVHQGEEVSLGGAIASDTPSLFAISDGLHVTPSAATASYTLLSLMAAMWHAAPDPAPNAKIRQLALRYREAAAGRPACDGMACTLLAAEIQGPRATLYHVGDSRAWLIRDTGVAGLTRDHTVLERMVRDGEIAGDEADRYASIYDGLDNYFIASAFEALPEWDIETLRLAPNDRLLLASDGLSVLTDADLRECVAGRGLDEAVAALIAAAIAAGSDDNLSVILLRAGVDRCR